MPPFSIFAKWLLDGGKLEWKRDLTWVTRYVILFWGLTSIHKRNYSWMIYCMASFILSKMSFWFFIFYQCYTIIGRMRWARKLQTLVVFYFFGKYLLCFKLICYSCFCTFSWSNVKHRHAVRSLRKYLSNNIIALKEKILRFKWLSLRKIFFYSMHTWQVLRSSLWKRK